jgi:hypothetical protein
VRYVRWLTQTGAIILRSLRACISNFGEPLTVDPRLRVQGQWDKAIRLIVNDDVGRQYQRVGSTIFAQAVVY